MPATYEPIASTTLTSTSTITFSSIPATYTDLVLITRLTAASSDVDLRFNGDTGANYSWTSIYSTGSSVGTTRNSNVTYARLDYYGYADTAIGQTGITHIQNYSNTSTFKTLITQNGNPDNGTASNVCLWRNTAAINSVSIIIPCFAGSIATLYGIKAA